MIIEKMSSDLLIPLEAVASIIKAASHQYKEYEIPKRSGGVRTIYHPSRRLKALQRWALSNIIEHWPVHQASMAYKKNTSILNNAQLHVNSRFLLRMDFSNFFPSITNRDFVSYTLRHRELFAKWSDEDFSNFQKLVFRFNRLTIGAPTSPALSSVLCYDLDVELFAAASAVNATYSRYADDLFFSCNYNESLYKLEQDVVKIVEKLILPGNLSINTSKTQHRSKRQSRSVTGVILGSDGKTHIGRDVKRHVRSCIFNLSILSERERKWLSGMIAYIVSIDPSFMNSIIIKYGLVRVRNAMNYRSNNI